MILFNDGVWQACLESYLQDLDQRPNKTHAMTRYPFHLCQFFTDKTRSPASYNRQEVEGYCKSPSCHGDVSMGSSNRRRAAIRNFYDFAATFAIGGQLLYQGTNPARAARVSNKDTPHLFNDEAWQMCLEHYLESLYRRSSSRGSVIRYQGVLRKFFEVCSKHPNDVTRSDCETFIYGRSPAHWCKSKDGTVTTSTVNSRISILRTFYDFSSGFTVEGKDGPELLYNRSNPTRGIAHGMPARSYKSLNQQEIKAFFSCIPDTPIGRRDRVCFLAFLLTCRRREELARLRWGDIEPGTVVDEDGTSHEGYLYHFTGKGHSGQRDVSELPTDLYQEIKDLLISEGRFDSIKPDDPIWIAHGPDLGGNVAKNEIRALTSKQMAAHLKKYAVAAHIDVKKFSIHSLRHTGAWLRKISGSDLFAVSRALRHRSLDQTRKYLEQLVVSGDSGSRAVSAKLAQLGVL